MRIVIEIDEGGAKTARLSTDTATDTAAAGSASETAASVIDLAKMQLRGTNAGAAPVRGGAGQASAGAEAAAEPGALAGFDAGQSAGAAPAL